MKIRNNYKGVDENLVKASFPYAIMVERPEIIEDEVDPEMDHILAIVTDVAGRTAVQAARIGETHNSTHWPGVFGWCNTYNVCPGRCFWVENQYHHLCTNCHYK